MLALADLLVQDDTNPRAFAGTLRRLRTELGKLPGEPGATATLRALLPADGAGLCLADLAAGNDSALRVRLVALVALARQLAACAASLSEAVGQRYFAHAHADVHAAASGSLQRV